MENLRTQLLLIQRAGKMEEYEVKERDYGDLVVFDIFKRDHYLLTLSRDGSILFMNFDASEQEKEVFRLPYLNYFVERIVNVF